jgi:uncharacterized protein YcbK (DUF882 family)
MMMAMNVKIHRRNLISLTCSAAMFPGAALALPAPERAPRKLRLLNAHTGETFDGIYRDTDGPLGSALADLSIFFRDFHSGISMEMDVGVIDFLSDVMDAVGVDRATILSAYRTPETNALLARTTFGVAEHSQHVYGRALDVYLGNKLTDAVLAARRMQRGGVGWYPHSGFLHLDTGPVRNWDLNDSGLTALLAYKPQGHTNSKPELIAGSGHLRPGMEQSGHLLPGLEGSGQVLRRMQP